MADFKSSKGQDEPGDSSTGVQGLQWCYLPARATEEEIKTFTNSDLSTSSSFQITSSFRASPLRKGGKEKPLIQLSSLSPAHRLAELLRPATAGALGLPPATPSWQHPPSPRELSGLQRQTADPPGEEALMR